MTPIEKALKASADYLENEHDEMATKTKKLIEEALQERHTVDVEEIFCSVVSAIDKTLGAPLSIYERAVVRRTLDECISQGYLTTSDPWNYNMDEAPRDGTEVLLNGKNDVGKSRIVNAIFQEKHTSIAEFCEDIEGLDEHNGEYYYPEGWYEVSWCNPDYFMFKISDRDIKPTAWMYIPPVKEKSDE